MDPAAPNIEAHQATDRWSFKRVSFSFILFILLLATLAAAVWLFLNRLPGDAVVTFPNGIIARHLATVAGGGSFTTEKKWEQIARRVLPRRWQSWIAQPITGSTSDNNTNNVTVFWEVIDPTGTPITNPPWGDYCAEDERGFRFDRGGGYSSWGAGLRGHQVFGLTLRAFPRRRDSFQFDFLDNRGALLASAQLPNPSHRPFPSWTPSALPITRTNGPLVLTLRGLFESGHDSYRWLRGDWQLKANDPRWTQAQPGSIQCEDATGNVGRFLSLWEPAWKLHLWIHRPKPEDFTADERLIVTNLAVPDPGELEPLKVTAKRAGVTLDVNCVAGAGRLYLTNGTTWGISPPNGRHGGWSMISRGNTKVESWNSDTPFLLVEATGLAPHDELHFRILDEQGHELKLEPSGSASGSGQSNSVRFLRRFTAPNDVKTISLEIIVSHPREFEFMINPAEIKRAEPNSK